MQKVRLLALASVFVLSVASVRATIITENFTGNPAANGWKTFGKSDLFEWNATNANLEVTWDSTNVNSYFYLPLGTVLTVADDFSVGFDLKITDVPVANGFELALGFLNFQSATNAGFRRGSGYESPNLAEFDYFPDFFSPSLTTIDANNIFNFLFDDVPLENQQTYRIEFSHVAGVPFVTGQILTNGVVYGTFPTPYTSTNFTDFRLDTFSVSSYSDANGYGSSILAHGVVDNIIVTLPPPPMQHITGRWQGSQWQAQFQSRSNWIYTLQRTTNFAAWTDTASATATSTNLILTDPNPPSGQGFYRVRAERP
jgi:hypothetical protein